MDLYEIQADVESIANDPALYEEANFDRRAGAVDFIEFKVIERIEGLLSTSNRPQELTALKARAQRIRLELEEIDQALFRRLRADIAAGVCTGETLRSRIEKYVSHDSGDNRAQDGVGYDSLDAFIAGLLLFNPFPMEKRKREPEMVYYQPTPGRIILELVEKAHLAKDDVFYDLGSGLGQVPILVNLLSGATAKGVEFEPAYCDYARACAAELGLSHVQFINVDARQADYSDGTVFFMYTPFEGRMLQEVLERLHGESQKRRIRLFSYGPCTAQVCRRSWLQRLDQNGDRLFKLSAFSSR